MTVKQLKEALTKFDEDLIIMLSSDEEGNSYGELSDEFVLMHLDKLNEEISDEPSEDTIPVLVLSP